MRVDEILKIEDDVAFLNKFVGYIEQKKALGDDFTEGERLFELYLSFMEDKDINGFADLFYQEFSFAECYDIINLFSDLGLKEASKSFAYLLSQGSCYRRRIC